MNLRVFIFAENSVSADVKILRRTGFHPRISVVSDIKTSPADSLLRSPVETLSRKIWSNHFSLRFS